MLVFRLTGLRMGCADVDVLSCPNSGWGNLAAGCTGVASVVGLKCYSNIVSLSNTLNTFEGELYRFWATFFTMTACALLRVR